MKSKIKIFHFHNGGGGGVLSVIGNLLKFSTNPDIENHLIYVINKDKFSEYNLPGLKGAKSERIFFYSAKWNFYYTCKQLAKFISDEDAILVAHDWLELGMASNLGLSNPVVQILHGDFNYYYNLALKHSTNIDAFVCVSKVIAEKLIQQNKSIESKVQYLRFPVPNVEYLPLQYDAIKCAYYVKDLTDERKQFKLLPLIEKGLNQKGIQIEWHIAGGKMTENELKDFWGDSYSSRVYFMGELDSNGINKLLSGCNIMILPSLSEGFPVGIVEAMKAGVVPLITDWDGATDELVINNYTGFLFKAGDVNGYIDKILDVDYDKTNLMLMSKRANTLARELFDPFKNTETYEKVFTDHKVSKQKRAFKSYGSRLDNKWIPNFITNFIRSL